MARTKGTLNLSGTLEVKAGGPLDARSLVPTLADLTTAANFPYPYVGMETYVVAENKKYRLIATPVTSSSNWEEVGSGGGGGGEDGGKMLTGTLLAASWSSKAQTVSVTGLKSDTIGAIGILNTATAAQVEAAREAVITPTTLANGTISFTCENVPSVDIPFGVMIPGGGSGGGSGVPEGGTTGQVLAKKSNTDGDVEWKDPADTSDCYKSDDENINTVADNDSIPLKSAAQGTTRNILFSDLKAKLKQYFDTIYSLVTTSKTAASGGTDLSLVTTGEKYNWNNKQNALTAGNNIGISGNVISGTNTLSLNFSTSEQRVGTWIDGKPIYQKTFTGTLNRTSSVGTFASTDISIGASVKHSLDIFGFAVGVRSDSGNVGKENNFFIAPYNSINNNDNKVIRASVRLNKSPSTPLNSINISNSWIDTGTYSSATYYVTVLYTKTTD